MLLVHAADLHIDSPLLGLRRYEGAPVGAIRGSTRRALDALVQLCLDREAALLLLAGDLFDGDWRDYSTGLFFAAQMSRLRQAGVRVAWVRGNHDAASRIRKHLRLPRNVVELSTRRPETHVFDDLGVAVHGQGFARHQVTEDLAATYPARVAGAFNVGLLHTCATGRPGHAPYAPTRLQVLADKGYDYWALGHVHTREVLSEEPWVVFPGNLQGRHARETGPKGATLIEVRDGRVVDVAHHSLDVVRWARCTVDVGEAADAHDAVDLVRAALAVASAEAGGRVLAARLVMDGITPAHEALAATPERWVAEVRAAANDVVPDGLWVERVELNTRPEVDAGALADRDDAMGQLVRSLRELQGDEAELAALFGSLDELVSKLPEETLLGPDGLRLGEPARQRELLARVESALLGRLAAREGHDG